jgi:predicted DNA-binding transcriptional regulator AlpA
VVVDRTADVLLTPAQVAELLGVSERTLMAWRNAEVSHSHPGRTLRPVPVSSQTIRYWRSDVFRWLEERVRESRKVVTS